MAFIPLSFNLDNKEILVIGGGKIALKKTQKLLQFTSNITCLSKEFLVEFKNLDIKKIENFYKKEYLKDFDLVVITIDDLDVHKQICDDCKELKILFSSSDFESDFSFNPFYKDKDLIVSVSSSGISPSFSKELLKYLENFIPKNSASFLKQMKQKREELPKGKERMKFFKLKTKEFFENLKN